VFALSTVKTAVRAGGPVKGPQQQAMPDVRSTSVLWPHFSAGSIPVFSKHDGGAGQDSQAESIPAAPTVDSAPQPEPTNPAPGASGTIPDIVTPPYEGKVTEPEISVPKADQAAGRVPVAVNLSMGPLQQPKLDANSAAGKYDPVASGVSMGTFSQPGGRAVSPFGAEFYEPAFSGISWAFSGGKCTISAKLDPICPWGTNAGGDIDVPSATDPVVTAATWKAIHDDLQPSATSPFKSPRTKYYSQALVERHEKFHGTDDLGWTTSTGIGFVKTSLEAGSVTAPASAADKARVDTDVANLLNTARTKLIAENLKFYKGAGADHDSFAGEIRAYADGKAEYQKLADAVEAQGKKLAAPPPVPAPAPGVFPPSPPPPKP